MNIRLRNILKIEHADIKLGGLTVLAGENNSGKSTVGRILFSLIKAHNNTNRATPERVKPIIRDNLFLIRRLFSRFDYTPDILKNNASLSARLIKEPDFVVPLMATLQDEASRLDLIGSQLTSLQKYCNNIRIALLETSDSQLAFKNELNAILRNEFQESILSHGTTEGHILFHDDTTDADGTDINVNFRNCEISDIKLWGNSSLEDATYIESPLFLQILNLLRSSALDPFPYRTSHLHPSNRENVPYHLSDMADKLMSEPESRINFSGNDLSALEQDLRRTIGGEFNIDPATHNLTFNEGSHALPPISVAAGIKSLGVLLQLIRTGYINPFSVLIWDEPEIHLHPEWQLVFCETVVRLVKSNVPVIISSHSPYLIQGIRYYAAAYGIEDITSYYFAAQQHESGLSVFENVTNDLNRVFSQLAGPLQQIMNVDEARNSKIDSL